MSQTEQRKKKPTSFDVARQAGVSRAAVSRTFTPNASVSIATREKVHRAAKDLGYRVNYLARSLINQRSDLVGIVVAGLDNPFRTLQLTALARALLARNFRPVLLPTTNDADTSKFIGDLLHYSVSGVLVTSDTPPTSLCDECVAQGVPIVLINKGENIPFVDRVISDNEAAGRMAAETLLARHARRPAVMAATHVSFTARQRASAFSIACEQAGLAAQSVALPANDYAQGFAHAAELVERGIDGLFCINDHMACGVIDGLKGRGIRVPHGIAIVGHDDIPQASWEPYQLTTMLQPCDLQAKQAIDLLVTRMITADLRGRVEVTPVSLVRRMTA